MREMSVRTVVVGSGCAGLNAADTLKALGEESLLLLTEDMNAGTSRNTGSDKQTYYKLSLSGDEGDSVGLLAHDLAYPDVNGDTALCEAAASARCFFRLCALGVPFPTNAFGEYVGYQTDHDLRRRATSAGPLTSRFMTEALERSVRSHGVPVLDHAVAARIVTGPEGVAALDVFLPQEKQMMRIRCANLILCTGGPAHIYQDRVYPESQHGMSGLAFAAGARGANLDCWQYGLASVSFRWNLSGSYQQALPRYVSVDADGTEREFLVDALGEETALAYTFLKGYQWPFDENRLNGSSRVDVLVKRETDVGRGVFLDYMHNPRGYAPERLTKEARAYLENQNSLGEIAAALSHVKAVAVMDKSEGFSGEGGPLFAEVRSACYDLETRPRMINVVYGLAGRDCAVEDIRRVYCRLQEILRTGVTGPLYVHMGQRSAADELLAPSEDAGKKGE